MIWIRVFWGLFGSAGDAFDINQIELCCRMLWLDLLHPLSDSERDSINEPTLNYVGNGIFVKIPSQSFWVLKNANSSYKGRTLCASGRKTLHSPSSHRFREKWIETTLPLLFFPEHGTFSNRTQIFIFSIQTERRGLFSFSLVVHEFSCAFLFLSRSLSVRKKCSNADFSAAMFAFNFEFQFDYFPVAHSSDWCLIRNHSARNISIYIHSRRRRKLTRVRMSWANVESRHSETDRIAKSEFLIFTCPQMPSNRTVLSFSSTIPPPPRRRIPLQKASTGKISVLILLLNYYNRPCPVL